MNRISILIIASVCLNAVSANYYCSLDCNGQKHTMCLFESEAMSSVCENVKTNVLTPEEKEVILKRHNELRVEHAKNAARGGLIGPVKYNEFRPITWSDELAEIAQRWANQCVDGHDKCRRTSYVEHVGQNIAKGSGDVKDLVDLWYGDLRALKSTEYDTIKNDEERWKVQDDSIRYSTFIWSEVTELGCGVVKTTNGQTTLVCNYGPTLHMINFP